MNQLTKINKKSRKYKSKKKGVESILGDRLDMFQKHSEELIGNNNENWNVSEFLCGMATENYVFAPILKYVIDAILSSDSLDVSFLYLPYIRPNIINLRAFIRHIIMGIFIHGGVILQSIRECNVVKFLTNWDDRSMGLDFCRTDVPESFCVDENSMVVFSPDRVPSMRNINCFNGIFSSYMRQFMDLSQLHHLFLVKLENLSMNVVVAEPNPNYLEEMFKIKNLTNEADYAAFIEREMIGKINRQGSAHQAVGALLNSMPAGGNTQNKDKNKYSHEFIEDVNALQDLQLRRLDVRTTVPMLVYDEFNGLRTDEVRNTSISLVPAGMRTKQHIPNVVGEHLFENLADKTKREIVQTLNLHVDPEPFLQKLRKEIEGILHLIFSHYITPPFFEDMIYKDIANELDAIQSFYEQTYILLSDEEIALLLKDANFVSLHASEYPNLQCFFTFNFMRAARKKTMKSDIERMLREFETLKKIFEKTIEMFEQDTINGSLDSFKRKAVHVKWGSTGVIEPFVTGSAKRTVGEEEKDEKNERKIARESLTQEHKEDRSNVE